MDWKDWILKRLERWLRMILEINPKLLKKFRVLFSVEEAECLKADFNAYVSDLIDKLGSDKNLEIIFAERKLTLIGQYHPIPNSFLRRLKGSLKRSNADTREMLRAMQVFGCLGHGGASNEMISLLEDEREEIRFRAILTLRAIHTASGLSKKKMRKIFSLWGSERPEVRIAAIELSEVIDKEMSIKALCQTTTAESAEERHAAVVNLKFVGGADALLPLVIALGDSDKGVVLEAQGSIKKIIHESVNSRNVRILQALVVLAGIEIIDVPIDMLRNAFMDRQEAFITGFEYGYTEYAMSEIFREKSLFECVAILAGNFHLFPENVQEKAMEALRRLLSDDELEVVILFRDKCEQLSLNPFQMLDSLSVDEIRRATAEMNIARSGQSPKSVQMDVTSILEHLLSIVQGRTQGFQQDARQSARMLGRKERDERRKGRRDVGFMRARQVA